MSVPARSMVHVGLSSWVIQDGNYGDFALGDLAKFALELEPLGDRAPGSEPPSETLHLGGSVYRVRGHVAFAANNVWVLDAGLFVAYCEQPPPDEVGAPYEGDISVGIDPFMYFERLHEVTGMPPLTYPWRVVEIHLDVRPPHTSAPDGPGSFTPDLPRIAYRPVQATNAWHEGQDQYVLTCSAEGPPARPATS